MTTPNGNRGLGKCENDHVGSYGYPTRPEEPYPFCPQCGQPVVWRCPACDSPLPDDAQELGLTRFCRQCGAPLFENGRPEAEARPAEEQR